MAQTDTWTNLVAAIEGYMGGAELQAEELAAVASLANLRAEEAYRESQLWPNWLVVSEQRYVNNDKIVYYDESSVFPSITTNKVDTFFRIGNKDQWNTENVTEFQYQSASTGARLVEHSLSYGFSKTLTGVTRQGGTTVTVDISDVVPWAVGDTIKLEGVTRNSGAGFDTDNPDPNGTQTITLAEDPNSIEFELSSGSGSETYVITNATLKVPGVYVTYKKQLDVTYGDGTGGTTSTIPKEWFRYIAMGVYSDMLAGEGRAEAALAWDGRARRVLQQELERIDAGRSAETIFNRVRTHHSESRQSTIV